MKVEGVTPSKLIGHARVMGLYLEPVMVVVETFK